jgi:hypothetical protein
MIEEFPFPRSAVALALLAVIVGRGLGQALPGSLTGIDNLIGNVEFVGAWLTQLSAALLSAQALRSVLVHVVTHRGQAVWKIVASGTALLITLETLFSALLSGNQLAPTWAALSAYLVLGTLGLGAVLALGDRERRGLGLIGLLIVGAGGAHTTARLIALAAAARASSAGFDMARWIATLGFALEAVGLAASFIWLLKPENVVSKAVSAGLGLLAIAVAMQGLGTEGWGLVVGRTLEQLSAHPDPFVPRLVRYTVELWGLCAVIGCCVLPKRPPTLLMALGLCLLGRSSADVPACAVFLLNAALALHAGRQSAPAQMHTAPAQ